MGTARRNGFTLIELSIVLVIIGLVVGGVLVGQDLIKVATDRRVISQVQSVQAAISTFRVKFNCLAGDCPNATDFFSDAVNGNGNGNIEEDNLNLFEGTNLFAQLSEASLLGSYHPPVNSSYDCNNAPATLSEPTMLSNVYIHARYDGAGGSSALHASTNYLTLHLGSCQAYPSFSFFLFLQANFLKPGLWPSDAQFIDTKIDDGLPLSGSVVIPLTGTGSNSVSCNLVDNSNAYNSDSLAGWGNCGLWIPFP